MLYCHGNTCSAPSSARKSSCLWFVYPVIFLPSVARSECSLRCRGLTSSFIEWFISHRAINSNGNDTMMRVGFRSFSLPELKFSSKIYFRSRGNFSKIKDSIFFHYSFRNLFYPRPDEYPPLSAYLYHSSPSVDFAIFFSSGNSSIVGSLNLIVYNNKKFFFKLWSNLIISFSNFIDYIITSFSWSNHYIIIWSKF